MSCRQSCTPSQELNTVSSTSIDLWGCIIPFPTWKCTALAGYIPWVKGCQHIMVMLLCVASVRGCFTKSAWKILLPHLSNNLTHNGFVRFVFSVTLV